MKAPAHQPNTDASLLRAIQQRNEDALAELYDRYAAMLYTFALRICGERGQAEEVLQDVFSTVWRAADLWDPDRGSVQAWLVTMTRHKAIDAMRANPKGRPLPLVFDVASDEEGPAERAEAQAIKLEVRAAVEQLPPAYREVLEAAYFSGLSQRQISERLGLPYGTVKSRIRLAIQRLARLLRARGLHR